MSDEAQSGKGNAPEESNGAEEANGTEESEGAEEANGTEESEGAEEANDTKGSERSGAGAGADTRKPISVRDLMPSPPTRPQRRTPEPSPYTRRPVPPEPSAGEEEKAPSTDEDAEDDAFDPEAPTPTPVRVAMDRTSPDAEAGAAAAEGAIPRTFEAEGEEWMVRVSGRSVSGTWPDSGAPLMHLAFYRPMDPDFPRRELLTVDRPLDALYDEDLRDLLARARPTRRGAGEGS